MALLAGALAVDHAACRDTLGPRLQDGAVTRLRPVVVDVDRWRTHAPGARFTVGVAAEVLDGRWPDQPVRGRWIDARGRELGAPFEISRERQQIASPDDRPGFYGLQLTSADPQVAFAPQPPGFPSAVYGFAVIARPPPGPAAPPDGSPFGLIQGRLDDPYLLASAGSRAMGVHLKTQTWQRSPEALAGAVARLTARGHTELPLLNAEPWQSVDTRPIGVAQLDDIGGCFARAARATAGMSRDWQVGVEENASGAFDAPYFFANLDAKLDRLRHEAGRIESGGRFVYSTRGFDMDGFDRLFRSRAFSACCAGLAQNPYRWPDFPSPETWLPAHLAELRARMDAAGNGGHFLWIGELGLPVRGNNDPDGRFGYGSKPVPGADMHYAAQYLVKCHLLAWHAGVERIYVYNYQNRGNDIEDPEHHFGLRTWSGDRQDPGHPMPAYVAYVTMLAHLKGASLLRVAPADAGLHAFEFGVEDDPVRTIVAWVHPGGARPVPLSALRPAARAEHLDAVVGLYGRAITTDGGAEVVLDETPRYVRLKVPD